MAFLANQVSLLLALSTLNDCAFKACLDVVIIFFEADPLWFAAAKRFDCDKAPKEARVNSEMVNVSFIFGFIFF
ncbi:hypothetical protein D3C85_1358210 [compost metagenome]